MLLVKAEDSAAKAFQIVWHGGARPTKKVWLSAYLDIPLTGCPDHGVLLLPSSSCPDVKGSPKCQRVVESLRLSSVPVKLGYA